MFARLFQFLPFLGFFRLDGFLRFLAHLGGYLVVVRPTVVGSRGRDGQGRGPGRGRSNKVLWSVIVACCFSPLVRVFFIHNFVLWSTDHRISLSRCAWFRGGLKGRTGVARW